MALDPFGLCGQVVEAQFRIDRAVGEGGFSVVYRAHHLGLNEPVAIKCLKLQAHLESDMIQEFAARFRDESRIMYKLSQGNLDIVRSMTSGTTVAPVTGALIPYMVLEWLEGKSLGTDLRERRVQNLKGRSIEEVIALFEPAANAVAFAHEQGVVHRDLKPGNLYLSKTASGIRLKVLDFGLAKIIDPTGGIIPSFQTTGNSTICSPSYGAPEQFDPSVGKIGPWTDVYALGLLVLELLRDKKVRKGEGLAKCALEALNREQPTATSLGLKLRPQLELALARAVAYEPTTRQKSASEFWADITRGAAKGKASLTVEAPLDGATVAEASVWADDLGATRVQGDSPRPPASRRSDAPRRWTPSPSPANPSSAPSQPPTMSSPWTPLMGRRRLRSHARPPS
jgi:serine/threonine protein kinase